MNKISLEGINGFVWKYS